MQIGKNRAYIKRIIAKSAPGISTNAYKRLLQAALKATATSHTQPTGSVSRDSSYQSNADSSKHVPQLPIKPIKPIKIRKYNRSDQKRQELFTDEPEFIRERDDDSVQTVQFYEDEPKLIEETDDFEYIEENEKNDKSQDDDEENKKNEEHQSSSNKEYVAKFVLLSGAGLFLGNIANELNEEWIKGTSEIREHLEGMFFRPVTDFCELPAVIAAMACFNIPGSENYDCRDGNRRILQEKLKEIVVKEWLVEEFKVIDRVNNALDISGALLPEEALNAITETLTKMQAVLTTNSISEIQKQRMIKEMEIATSFLKSNNFTGFVAHTLNAAASPIAAIIETSRKKR